MMGNASQLSEGSLLPACARRLHLLNVTAGERATFSISKYLLIAA